MLQRFRIPAAPPVFDDEEKTRLAWLLQTILIIISAGILLLILSMFLFFPERLNRLPNSLIILALFVGDLYVMRSGRVRLAASLLGISCWIILTLICISVGGVLSTAFGGFLILIILMGLLTGKWGSFIFAGLSILSGALLLVLNNTGRLPAVDVPPSADVRFIVFSIYFLFAAALLYLASISIEKALARAKRGESDLAERNRELLAEINERKRIEDALRASETQLRLALEAAQMRAWHWDIESGKIRASDHVHLNSSEISQNDKTLSFETFLAQVHPDDVQAVQDAVRQASAIRESYTAQYRLADGEGAYKWYEAVGKVQSDESGRAVSMIGVAHNITARKDAENQQLNFQLQKERLGFLTEFMGNMSHDLRTPLTVIKTSIYLMERLTDPEKIHQRLQIVSAQIDLVERYIDDILTISRLDARLELALEPININQAIQEVEERLRPTAEQKNLKVNLELEEPALTLFADMKQIDHVLMNLIENAYNYTPEEGTVTIRVRANDAALLLEVRDTGIGVSEEDIPLIFNRFYRGENARHSRRGGTGLGLAIVKKIVEMHDGKIDLESKLGEGTTFRIQLPLRQPIASTASL